MKQDLEVVDAEQVVNDAKVIAVYFSAHWCPPCRNFTPVLKDFHEELKDDGLVIIFASSDRTEEDMKNYFSSAHGDYYCIPFADEEGLRASLNKECQVSGIPMLCVISKEGKLIHADGRSDVTGKPPKAVFSEWLQKSS